MEDKKHNNKLIIFIVLTIALVTLIISFLVLKNTENKLEEESDLENSVFQNQISNTSTSKNETKEPNDTSTSNNAESNGNEVIIESDGNTQINLSDKDGTGGIGITEGNGNFGISTNGSGNSGSTGENGNINTGATGNSGVATGNDTDINNENENFNTDAEIVENPKINELYNNNNLDYEENIDDNTSAKSNIKEYDRSIVTVEGNEYSNLDVNLNLLNAPYNNKEYCERILSRNYVVKLTEKPKGSTCSNYPEYITFDGEGKLDEYKHIYTKVGKLDFTNTYFNTIGDYYFTIYDETSNEALYQIIVTFRYITTEEGYTTGKTYSLIQIKSILQNAKKVNNININLVNPNTSITVNKKFVANSFWEKVYVDVYIDSYNYEKYTVLDGNALDGYLNSNTNSTIKIGEHLVARNENNQVVPQTYKLSKGGKVVIGRKDPSFIVGVIFRLATTGDISGLGISYQTDKNYSENKDDLEIPAGTKYKVNFSENKKYREEYAFEAGGGDFVEASVNPESNLAVLVNLTEKNPKTGIFYNIAPFIIVIVLAVLGIIIIKNTSFKEDEDK